MGNPKIETLLTHNLKQNGLKVKDNMVITQR